MRGSSLSQGAEGATPSLRPMPAVRAALTGLIAAAGLVAFVSIRPEQVWILWLTSGLVALSVDGLVRGHPRWVAGGFWSTWVYLVLPLLGVLAVGYFADEALTGFVRPAAAAIGGLIVGAAAFAEYHTADVGSPAYGAMRLFLAVLTYLTAFALFTVVFAQGVDVPLASLIVGAVAAALAVELLRESQLLGTASFFAGLAVGITLGELRAVLYFFPLDALLAGALLIIGFYLATGIVHHLLDHDLTPINLAEYLLVTVVSTGAVVAARVIAS